MVVGSPLARGLAGHVQQLGRETAQPHKSNGHLLFSLPATSRARSAAAVVGFWSALGPRAFACQAVPPQSVSCIAITDTQVALEEASVRMEWSGCSCMWKMPNFHGDFEEATAGHGGVYTSETVSCHPHGHTSPCTIVDARDMCSEPECNAVWTNPSLMLREVWRNRAQCSRCLCETLHV